jgi:shikimate kinase
VTPRAILIGAPGAGKTTVGEILAGGLGCSFSDSDQLVEAAHGQSVADIFIDHGESVFREWEARAITQALGGFDGVLSLGGGAVMDMNTAKELTASTSPIIWLEVSSSVAFRRAGLSAPRPLLVGNVRANLVSLLESRTPIYESLATHRIDANTLDAQQLAQQISDLLTNGVPC